jgi:hypothetical protein
MQIKLKMKLGEESIPELLIIIHFQKLLVTLLPQTLKIKAKQEV